MSGVPGEISNFQPQSARSEEIGALVTYAGAKAFLEKSVDNGELLAAIR